MFADLYDYLYHQSPTGGIPLKGTGIVVALALIVAVAAALAVCERLGATLPLADGEAPTLAVGDGDAVAEPVAAGDTTLLVREFPPSAACAGTTH